MTDRHLLPRFRQVTAGTVQHIIDIVDHPTPTQANTPITAGGDPLQLRGIPAIGQGSAGGHIPGTRPDHIPFEHIRRKL